MDSNAWWTQVQMPSPLTPNQIFIVVTDQDKEGKVQSVKKTV